MKEITDEYREATLAAEKMARTRRLPCNSAFVNQM